MLRLKVDDYGIHYQGGTSTLDYFSIYFGKKYPEYYDRFIVIPLSGEHKSLTDIRYFFNGRKDFPVPKEVAYTLLERLRDGEEISPELIRGLFEATRNKKKRNR